MAVYKDKKRGTWYTSVMYGYLSKEQERTGNGKFGKNIIEIHDTPIVVAPN